MIDFRNLNEISDVTNKSTRLELHQYCLKFLLLKMILSHTDFRYLSKTGLTSGNLGLRLALNFLIFKSAQRFINHYPFFTVKIIDVKFNRDDCGSNR